MLSVVGGGGDGGKLRINKYKSSETFSLKLDRVFATNSDFLIPLSLQPNAADLTCFKQWTLIDQII